MRVAALLALLALAARGDDPPPPPSRKISYEKRVMADPAYKSSWSAERISAALADASRPRAPLVPEPPPVQVVRVVREPCVARWPVVWWGLSFRFGRHHRPWRRR